MVQHPERGAPVSIMKSVDRSPVVINQTVQASVVDSGETSQSAVPLRLRVERRAEDYLVQLNNEKELRFHFSEHITDAKFKELSVKWGLRNVGMDEFFQDRLSDLLQSASIKCIVSSDRQRCTLEFETRQQMFIIRMAMELGVVAGEDLLQHLINTVQRQNNNLSKMYNKVKALSANDEENRRMRQENAELAQKVEDLTSKLAVQETKYDSLERDLRDVQNDHEMTKDRLEEVQQELDGEVADYEELNRDYQAVLGEKQSLELEFDRVREDLETSNIENGHLRAQVDRLQQDVDKANHIIRKYYSDAPAVSVSDAKLRELEEAGREKDLLIEQLKKQSSEIQQKCEQVVVSVKAAQEKMDQTNKALVISENGRKLAEDKVKTLMTMVSQQNTPRRVLPPNVGMPSTSRVPLQQMNPYSPQFDYAKMVSNNSPLLTRPGPLPSPYVPATPLLNKYLQQNNHISPLSGRTTPTVPAVPPSILGPSTSSSLTPILDRAIREKENAPPPSNRLH